MEKFVEKPWGGYKVLYKDGRCQVKMIQIEPNQKISLQKHFHRSEHWTIVKGTAIVTVLSNEIILKEDEYIYVPVGSIHRLENRGKITLEIIEVQYGDYLGEDDIVRFEDIYGREKK